MLLNKHSRAQQSSNPDKYFTVLEGFYTDAKNLLAVALFRLKCPQPIYIPPKWLNGLNEQEITQNYNHKILFAATKLYNTNNYFGTFYLVISIFVKFLINFLHHKCV